MRTSPYTLQSVDKALQLLLLLSEAPEPLRLSEIATSLGVAPSTAHRLLGTLVARDFAAQNNDSRYEVGRGLGRIAARRGARRYPTRDLVRVAIPHLEALSSQVGETVHLMVLSGREVKVLHSIEGVQALRIGSRTGLTMLAEQASGGKALLAELSTEELQRRYADDPALLAKLLRSLPIVRRTGYATNNGETERGIVAIGTCVPVADGPATAAISVSIPSIRFQKHRAETLAARAKEAARRLADDLA